MSDRMYHVIIGGVDQETDVTIECHNAQAALTFLAQHDHEGSTVTITISYHDAEQGYEALERLALEERESEKRR
jgi:hypothetical protein